MKRLIQFARPRSLWLFAGLACLCLSSARGDDDPRQAQVRESLAALGRAFNAHDAQAVAAAWATDGVLTDEAAGLSLQGRAAIQEHYAKLFQATPLPTLKAELGAIEFPSDNAALVHGSATVSTGDESSEVTDFAAELKREGDRWLLVSVVESDHDPLSDLEWLVGDWVDEASDGQAKSSFAWNETGRYLIRTFTAPSEGNSPRTGTQYIAWDAQQGRIRSWAFNSSGAIAEGHWSPAKDHWAIYWDSTLGNGSAASAIQVLTPVDEDSFTVEWTNIEVDGQLRPSSEPVMVRRSAGAATEGGQP